MSKKIQEAYSFHRRSFFHVLATLEEEGVKLHQAEAPALLGLTRREFNRKCLATAVALWSDVQSYIADPMPGSNHELLATYNCLLDISNVHQILKDTGADVQSDKGFKILGTTKQEFQSDFRAALVSFLKMTNKYNGEYLSRLSDDPVACAVMVCEIDPASYDVYQEAGFASRADYDEKCAEWKKADAKSQSVAHSCCGHDHHHNHN